MMGDVGRIRKDGVDWIDVRFVYTKVKTEMFNVNIRGVSSLIQKIYAFKLP
jgi:hypothetical protein